MTQAVHTVLATVELPGRSPNSCGIHHTPGDKVGGC